MFAGKYEYVGWIPTVTGYLSFSKDSGTKCPHWEDGLLSDVTFPGLHSILPRNWPFKFGMKLRSQLESFFGINSYFKFCWIDLQEAPENTEVKKGAIVVLNRKNFSRLDDIDKAIQGKEYSTIASLADACAMVEVWRNGAYKSALFINENNDMMAEYKEAYGSDLDADISKVVYYHVRDRIHSHYHHSTYSDSIIGIFKLNPSAPNDWQKSAFKNLMRKVMIRRGSKQSFDLYDCLGMLQYARKFSDIFFNGCSKSPNDLPEWARPTNADFISGYGFSELESSINAALGKSVKSSHLAEKIRGIWRFHFGPIFTLLAILIALTGLLQVGGEPVSKIISDKTIVSSDLVSMWWIHIVRYIFLNPDQFLLFVLFYAPFITMLPILSRGFSYGDKDFSSSFIRDVTRYAIAFSRGSKFGYSAFLLFVCFAFAGIFYKLFSYFFVG
jgi:hypothetical protein